jgi:hypothetical protein
MRRLSALPQTLPGFGFTPGVTSLSADRLASIGLTEDQMRRLRFLPRSANSSGLSLIVIALNASLRWSHLGRAMIAA